jgi:GNAT superfamily N-acetyltransferase
VSTIRVSRLPLEQIGRVQPLLEKARQKPYRFLLGDLRDNLVAFWLNQIVELCRAKEGEVFSVAGKGKIEGIAVFNALPWETRIFGKKMGILKHIIVDVDCPHKRDVVEQLLGHLIDWAGARGNEFLLCKTYTDDILTIHALEKHGFLLMDTILDYVFDFREFSLCDIPNPPLPKGAEVRLATEDDIEELLTVARKSFRDHFGRFHADERISKRKATQVYEEWVKSSFEGFADWILVAEIDGRITGYSVMKKPSSLEQTLKVKVGEYNIGGVHPDYRGQGLFSYMSYEVMKLFNGKVDCILGPTHVNNNSLQRVLNKLIWRICDARHSFHRWLSE